MPLKNTSYSIPSQRDDMLVAEKWNCVSPSQRDGVLPSGILNSIMVSPLTPKGWHYYRKKFKFGSSNPEGVTFLFVNACRHYRKT
jgi:hypothetical protein